MEGRSLLRQLLMVPRCAGEFTDRGGPEEVEVASALHLWIILSRAHDAVASRDQRSLDRHKLTRAEFGVLDALFFKGPLLLGDIQKKILVSSGGVTYLVDRLEGRGLVERSPSPDDRRAVFASLTAEGERFFREIFGDHVRDLVRTLSALDPTERSELIRLLKKMGTGAARLTEAEGRG